MSYIYPLFIIYGVLTVVGILITIHPDASKMCNIEHNCKLCKHNVANAVHHNFPLYLVCMIVLYILYIVLVAWVIGLVAFMCIVVLLLAIPKIALYCLIHKCFEMPRPESAPVTGEAQI